MSAIPALEAEVSRVLRQASEIKAEFGDPVRLIEDETGRAAFPFLRLSRHDVRPQSDGVAGLSEHRLNIEVLSRAGGRTEASRLVGVAADALRNATLTPAGYRVVLSYPVYADVFLRRDGTTFRGLLRLRALTEPV